MAYRLSETRPRTTECPGCGTKFTAEREHAGMVFVCSCGRRLAVPEHVAGRAYLTDDRHRGDLIACPQCRRLWDRHARVCTTCGYDFQTGSRYQVETDDEDRDGPIARYDRSLAGRLYRWKDREIPIAMTVGGIIMIVILHLGLVDADLMGKLLSGWALIVAMQAGWMLVYLAAIELIANRDFGTWQEEVLKVFAIATMLTSFSFLMGWFFDLEGQIIALPILFIVQVALMRWFFELSWFAAAMVSFVMAVATAMLLF